MHAIGLTPSPAWAGSPRPQRLHPLRGATGGGLLRADTGVLGATSSLPSFKVWT